MKLILSSLSPKRLLLVKNIQIYPPCTKSKDCYALYIYESCCTFEIDKGKYRSRRLSCREIKPKEKKQNEQGSTGIGTMH